MPKKHLTSYMNAPIWFIKTYLSNIIRFAFRCKKYLLLYKFFVVKNDDPFFLLINTNFLYLQHAIMLGVSSIFCKLTPSVWLSKMVERAFALPFTVEPILVIVRTHSTRYSRERSESLVSRHSGNKICKCFFSYLLFETRWEYV